MKYYAKYKEGGPYTLSEIAQKFGDDVELIPAKVEQETKSMQPKHLELPKIPTDGGMMLAAIAFSIALVGCAAIGFGIIPSVGQPREYEMTRVFFGGVGFLADCLAVIVGLCALIARPSALALVALSLALLSGAALLYVPSQTRPRPSRTSHLSLQATFASQCLEAR